MSGEHLVRTIEICGKNGYTLVMVSFGGLFSTNLWELNSRTRFRFFDSTGYLVTK